METIIDIGRRITKLSAEARKAWEATEVAARAEEIHLCEAVQACEESLAGKITASIIRDLQTFIDQAA